MFLPDFAYIEIKKPTHSDVKIHLIYRDLLVRLGVAHLQQPRPSLSQHPAQAIHVTYHRAQDKMVAAHWRTKMNEIDTKRMSYLQHVPCAY